MPRSRVLSFMSQWGGGAPRSPTSEASPTPEQPKPSPSTENIMPARRPTNLDTTPASSRTKLNGTETPPSPSTTPSRARGDSKPPRPMSMVQAYNPPQVEVSQDTPPELQPIFSYLNSHSNKLYTEGYFLKLHDLDSRGRPSADRTWVECFAQLIGTVLSLWDASALDAAGEDGEVVPSFVNLSDASVRIIESLPMSGVQGGSLQNVLSISTAANNRYLLHFNSKSSLTQWAAGIRLAMFEHTTLQEAYTGSLIAGKGRYLNNIKQIMYRTQFAHEDWARVRFGAGKPWRRCWCVISPPDEKEYKKEQKTLKKNNAYDKPRVAKGDIKFYDTRKVTKKTRPLATISDVFAAYAIYPQSKPLIEQSTLVKLEGMVTLHDSSESTSEGFVFVMPEVHAAVTGFEMMLRWLFPVFDTFALYGRPNKLIADTLDQRGLMFAMPTNRRYGYLDALDVSGLVHAKGSQLWSERQWRRELKKLTAERMTQQMEGYSGSRQASQRRNTTSRNSFNPNGVRFGSHEDVRSSPGSRSASPAQGLLANGNKLPRTDSAPPGGSPSPHKRSVSEAQGYMRYQTETPSRLSYEQGRPSEDDTPPPPPAHGGQLGAMLGSSSAGNSRQRLERIESEAEVPTVQALANPEASPHLMPPEPVGAPPAFTHSPNSRPGTAPYQAPDLRRAQSNVDVETLNQMQDAVRGDAGSGAPDVEENGMWHGDVQERQQNTVASPPYTNSGHEVPADRSQGIVNRKLRDPRQRLSTIPGSPYIPDEAQVFQSPTQMGSSSQLDGVDEVVPELSQSDLATPPAEGGAPTLHSSKSIARKPVPGRALPPPLGSFEQPQSIVSNATPAMFEAPRSESQSAPPGSFEPPPPSDPSSPSSVTNLESWEGGILDEEALDRVLNQADRSATMTTESTEPDYASTISKTSSKPKQSIERPRAGRLKTVGDPDIPAGDPRSGGAGRLDTWQADQAAQAEEIPAVDFGPTYAYKPKSRPGTSGTLTPGDMSDKRRSRSAEQLSGMLGGAIGVSPRPSPNEANRLSYFSNAGRTTPSPGRMTPEFGRATPSPGRITPSPGRITPEFGVAGDRSSMVWQGPTSPGNLHRSKTSVTPEEWVQQRAAMAAQQPQYAMPARKPLLGITHSRSNSAQGQRNRLTKTPPLNRTASGDWTQYMRKTPPLDRPSSRGAGVNLDTAGSSLSAREQMQVSRATGTPLLGIKNNDALQQPDQPGMIGFVAARERDKAASREGRNSVAVQQAILERQQQQLRAEAEAQYQAQAQAHAQAQQQAAYQAQQAQWYQQNQMAMQYGGVGQQRPGVQQRNSWHQGQVLAGGQQQGGYVSGPPLQLKPSQGQYSNGVVGQQPQQQTVYQTAYPQPGQQHGGTQGQQWRRQ